MNYTCISVFRFVSGFCPVLSFSLELMHYVGRLWILSPQTFDLDLYVALASTMSTTTTSTTNTTINITTTTTTITVAE